MIDPTPAENIRNALQLMLAAEVSRDHIFGASADGDSAPRHIYDAWLLDMDAIRVRLEAALTQLDGAAQLDGRTPI